MTTENTDTQNAQPEPALDAPAEVQPAAPEAPLTAAQRARRRADSLAAEAAQARAKAQRLEAVERAREAGVRRAEDTRRKVLLGAYVLQNMPHLAHAPEFGDWLTRDDDRRVFGLQPLPQPAAPVSAAPVEPPADPPIG